MKNESSFELEALSLSVDESTLTLCLWFNHARGVNVEKNIGERAREYVCCCSGVGVVQLLEKRENLFASDHANEIMDIKLEARTHTQRL